MSAESFHFLRPAWLLALPLVAPVLWSALRARAGDAAWRRVCEPHLLEHLVARGGGAGARWPLALLALGWLGACVALAGPSWERLPQPAYREPTQTVLVLSLAPSMDRRDVAPTRLARARYELIDALDRVEGAVALVIFGEEPYAVTPLTDDPRVIAATVPTLATDLMPGRGAFAGRAIDEARQLLDRAGAVRGRILLISDGDGDDPEAAVAAARRASQAGYPVSVLRVGGDGGKLRSLAAAGGGRLAELAPDARDIEALLEVADEAPAVLSLEESAVPADVWRDMGAWLVLLPLALAPLAFRRGWAGTLALALLLGASVPDARADALDSLWQRDDQRAQRAFREGRHAKAAELFDDPAWQAAARYRSGDYAGAAETLAPLADPRSRYNRGNALARSGQLEEAIAAYDEALAGAPDDDDARHNRELVKRLLEQQQQEPQEQEPQEQKQKQQGQEQPDAANPPPEPGGSGDGDETGAGSEPNARGPEDEPADGGRQADRTPAPGETPSPPTGDEAERDGAAPGSPRELSEQDQATEQWLSRIPDDPGALLRERLRRSYLARKRAARSSR